MKEMTVEDDDRVMTNVNYNDDEGGDDHDDDTDCEIVNILSYSNTLVSSSISRHS